MTFDALHVFKGELWIKLPLKRNLWSTNCTMCSWPSLRLTWVNPLQTRTKKTQLEKAQALLQTKSWNPNTWPSSFSAGNNELRNAGSCLTPSFPMQFRALWFRALQCRGCAPNLQIYLLTKQLKSFAIRSSTVCVWHAYNFRTFGTPWCWEILQTPHLQKLVSLRVNHNMDSSS